MAEPIPPLKRTQTPWHISKSEERLRQEQLAALHAMTKGEITETEATARVKIARARHLRHKAHWHIVRAGNGGSHLLAEQYVRQAEMEERLAAELRKSAGKEVKPNVREQPEG